MKLINNKILVMFLLIFTIMPLVYASVTVVDENGKQSATISVESNGNSADVLIENEDSEEVFISGLTYPLQVTENIGLGRYSEEILEPFICIEGDLECEEEKQNRVPITIYSDTNLFSFPYLEFDYATLKLNKYTNNIDNMVSCSDFNVETFECNSEFKKEDINIATDDDFIYFNLTHFSGWTGTSYLYADMEDSGVDLCRGNGDEYKGYCDGDNALVTDYTENVFMNNESMRISSYESSEKVYAYDTLPLEIQTGEHYSRIYIYLSKEDVAGISTIDSPIFSVVDSSGTTTSCGFLFDKDSKEEISCIYDVTSATYNPIEFGDKINITEWGLWNKWITLEYLIDINDEGGNNCTCWVNGSAIASKGDIYYDSSVKYTVVGYPINIDNGAINLTFDEHRSSDKYIGGYPEILDSYVAENPVNPDSDQTVYAELRDNEGLGDINFVRLRFNSTLNIAMYQLESSNIWEGNISSIYLFEGENYTYTVYANDSNGQDAVPSTGTFTAGICYYDIYLLEPTSNLGINISESFTMKGCYNTTGTCVFPNNLYHQYYNGIWDVIPISGNELISTINSFSLNTCPSESEIEVECSGTGEYKVRGLVDVNISSSVNITCGTIDPDALTAIETGINNVIPTSTISDNKQVYNVNLDSDHTLGTFDKVAILDNQTWGLNYVNTTESYVNVNSLDTVVNILELANITYYEIISNVENFISGSLI